MCVGDEDDQSQQQLQPAAIRIALLAVLRPTEVYEAYRDKKQHYSCRVIRLAIARTSDLVSLFLWPSTQERVIPIARGSG